MGVRAVTGLELCSGIGALGLGVRRVFPGYLTVAHVEREAYACAVLAARMAEGSLDPAPIWDDLATFDGEPWCGVVDIVTAGFPCQPASLAGKRAGLDDERWLWDDVERILRVVRPRYVLLENVPGLLTVSGGGAIARVLGSLAELGFDAEWGCLRASDVGAPHGRNRWWCLAWDRQRVADADHASTSRLGSVGWYLSKETPRVRAGVGQRGHRSHVGDARSAGLAPGEASDETMERNARPLNEQVSHWPTPSSMSQTGGENVYLTPVLAEHWRRRRGNLHEAVADTIWPESPTHQAPATETAGPPTSPPTPTSRLPLRLQLNAKFVEALLGVPINWTCVCNAHAQESTD